MAEEQRTQQTSTEQQQPQDTVGGGQADGSPNATSHTAQPVGNIRPGTANTAGGALNTGPRASEHAGPANNQ